MAESVNRKINIWINGRQVENNFKDISNAMRKAKNELANMTVGSKEYIQQTEKIKQLKAHLDNHKKLQGQIAQGWVKITNAIKQIAVGNIIAGIFDKLVSSVSGAFGKINTAVSDFEGGMTNVFTLLEEHSEARFASQMKEGAKDVAELGFVMNDVTKSMFDAVSAGVEAGRSVSFMNDAAVLAKGGVTSLSTSVDGITTLMNAYGESADQAGTISNAFFTAQKFGKTTVDQLASSIGKAAPVASSLGISYQQLLSATSALTLKGISTSESVNYLKAAMSNLLKPSTEAEKVLRKFGVPVGATEVKAAGFTNTLEKLNQVIQKHPDEIAKAIPSVEALTAVQALSGNGLEKYKEILQAVQTDIGENSSLQRAYQKQMESFPNVMAQARARLNNFAVELGEKLAPLIKAIVPMISGWTKKVMELINWMIKNSDAIKTLVKWVGIAATAIGAYAAAEKIYITWTKLKVLWDERAALSTKLLTKAQDALAKSTKSNPWGLVLSAVTAAISAYIAFKDKISVTKKSLQDFNAELITEKTKLNDVFEAIKLTGEGTDERKELIIKLNKEYGEYLPSLLTEKSTLEQIEKAQIHANDALETNIALKHKALAIEEAISNYIEAKASSTSDILDAVSKKNASNVAQATKELNDLIAFSEQEGATTIESQMAKILPRVKEFTAKFGGNNQDILLSLRKITTAYKEQQETLTKLDAVYSGYKEKVKETSDSDQSTDPETKKTKELGPTQSADDKKKAAEEEAKKLEEFYKSYNQLIKSITDLRKKFNLDTLTEEEKAIQEINDSYDSQLEVVEGFINELEAKRKTKEGLDQEELDLLSNFYTQQYQLIELNEAEVLKKQKEFDQKKLDAKKELQEKIEDILLSDYEREVKVTTEKYEKLIAEAEKYGLDTYNLYQKMLFEIDQLSEGIIDDDTDIFGMTEEDWEELGEKFQKVAKFANESANILDAFFTLQSNREKQALADYEDANEKKRQSLDSRLKKGLISQEKYDKEVAKLDKLLDIEKKKLAIADAKRSKEIRTFDAIISTAGAIIGFLANPGGWAGIALAAMAGITGGIQIAAIANEPIPKMAKGARVNKPTKAIIGEAGPEIVLANSIVSDPELGPIADDLARVQEGKQPRILKRPQTPNYSGMKEAIGRSVVNSVTNNTVVNTVDNAAINKMNDKIEQMSSSIMDMTKTVKEIKYLRAVITDDDLTDHDEEKKLKLKYSGF